MPLVRPKRQYESLPVDLLRNKRLSFAARGLLARLCTNAVGFRQDARALADEADVGRHTILKLLSEICVAGYILNIRIRRFDTRQFTSLRLIDEVPAKTDEDLIKRVLDSEVDGVPLVEIGRVYVAKAHSRNELREVVRSGSGWAFRDAQPLAEGQPSPAVETAPKFAQVRLAKPIRPKMQADPKPAAVVPGAPSAVVPAPKKPHAQPAATEAVDFRDMQKVPGFDLPDSGGEESGASDAIKVFPRSNTKKSSSSPLPSTRARTHARPQEEEDAKVKTEEETPNAEDARLSPLDWLTARGVAAPVAGAWLATLKKPPSGARLENLAAQAQEAGRTLADVVTIMTQNGWGTFTAAADRLPRPAAADPALPDAPDERLQAIADRVAQERTRHTAHVQTIAQANQVATVEAKAILDDEATKQTAWQLYRAEKGLANQDQISPMELKMLRLWLMSAKNRAAVTGSCVVLP